MEFDLTSSWHYAYTNAVCMLFCRVPAVSIVLEGIFVYTHTFLYTYWYNWCITFEHDLGLCVYGKSLATILYMYTCIYTRDACFIYTRIERNINMHRDEHTSERRNVLNKHYN